MALVNFAMKAACLAATILLVAACETPVEESQQTSGSGGAKQETKIAKHKHAHMEKKKPSMADKVVPGSQEDLVLKVGNQIQFDLDKSVLRDDARETVKRWRDWLQQYPAVTVAIEGHCDERGTREYNLALGERRANAVKDYLMTYGISGNRIATISYGKERPVNTGSDTLAWSQNRRSVTVKAN